MNAPPQQVPLTDASGKITLPWYQYLARLADAIGPSPTANDDAALLALTALSKATK